MSVSTKLDELQKKKAELENELQSFDEREKTMGINVQILEEKLAIRELKQKIEAKRAVVERLESKKRDLENRSKKP